MEEFQENNELESKDSDLEIRLDKLESENQKMRDEFDCQRAKMKELFLQKENELSRKKEENDKLVKENHKLKTELGEVQSQLMVVGIQSETNVAVEKRKAAEEIATLQQLVQETVEESSTSHNIYDTQLKKLHTYIRQIEKENVDLKYEKQQSPHHVVHEQSSLAPSVVLSAVTKRIAKKLGAEAFTSQDDEHREDAELLRSLVVPLEEEIKALKDKLRATDDQLQKCNKCGHLLEQEAQLARSLQEATSMNQQQVDGKQPISVTQTSTNTSFEAKGQPVCDMCSNYEAQLVREQKRCTDLEAKVVVAEKAAERHKVDLGKEIGFRKDMEEKWNEKREEHKLQVGELTRRMLCTEQDLKELQDSFNQSCREMRDSLTSLTHDRENVDQELDKLQKENDNLMGKYSVHSQQLQSEFINLPDTVEELHELILKSHQELIIAKIGKEAAEEKGNNLRSDIMLLKDQIVNEQQGMERLKARLVTEMNTLKDQKHKLESERKGYVSNLEKIKIDSKQNVEKLSELQSELNEVSVRKKYFEDKNNELKSRVASLQQELDTSETVQKDFVRLSQNLQVQLEKIRDADTQVRWQHEEDIEDCPNCRSSFSLRTKRKEHCKHCGQVFCSGCLTHSVPSGPHQRPSRVCDVCHTLLVKSSAPYFSTEAPHSPD